VTVSLGASARLRYDALEERHADVLHSLLVTPEVLAFIDEPAPPSLTELRQEYAARSNGPPRSRAPEQWHNAVIVFEEAVIGRLEATSYGHYGEVAYLLGQPWWGRGFATEAMHWWHEKLERSVPGTHWWATVHPENRRSIRLLERLGYSPAEQDPSMPLSSFSSGDRCFVRLPIA
jgi:RimJ/RimL family protein N-acetyltransferase